MAVIPRQLVDLNCPTKVIIMPVSTKMIPTLPKIGPYPLGISLFILDNYERVFLKKFSDYLKGTFTDKL